MVFSDLYERKKMSSSTSEVAISTGIKKGVYTKMPTPAIKVLANMKKYTAQRILVALCTYMDINSHQCWPSYTAIAKRAGVGRGNIKKNLDLLVHLGLIKVSKRSTGNKRQSNFYTVTYLGYQENRWGPELRDYLPYVGICLACGNNVKSCDYDKTESGEVIHLRCGGTVHKLKKAIPSRPINRKDENSIPRGYMRSNLGPGETLGVEHLKLRKQWSL